MPITLIGGGSRSGKSRYALELARKTGGRLAFVATAQAFDDEMRDRISRHRTERGWDFETFEEPIHLDCVIAQLREYDAVVVDCLTLWLSNLMLAQQDDFRAHANRLIHACESAKGRVVLVTNEVGAGIVPDNALAREFRDQAGWLNQQVAERAQSVYWMVFGIPLQVK
ncbi:MAG TPA: bifunctional adenosylcobinamide kinase/adenosylcobinamide-phosphate guanylyltransferase [Bryobacteraceae bacterium]|nr:bifunctional adenosylcobinamide kinase/adenosylcobinamide-phosphate guanylyltransferase [Bryobacteraceae bacterium]